VTSIDSVVTALRTVSDKLTWDSVAARLQEEYDCRESSCPNNNKKALKAHEVKKRKDNPKCYWLREGRPEDSGL
jgi:hypothetical protein